MTALIYLLTGFGLAFLAANKIPALHRRSEKDDRTGRFLHAWLDCVFCQGAWGGAGAWLLSWLVGGRPVLDGNWVPARGGALVAWTFAAATFYYALYAAIAWLEDSLEGK